MKCNSFELCSWRVFYVIAVEKTARFIRLGRINGVDVREESIDFL